MALRGALEDTDNPALVKRGLLLCDGSIPATSAVLAFHNGKGLNARPHLRLPHAPALPRTEVHNELLHDESVAFAPDKKYPEPDHAPVVAAFEVP